MEQRKVLWVMMSVSLLLVVLLGIGMFLPYLSRGSLPDEEDSGETVQTVETHFDAIEYIREGDIAGIEETEPVEEDFVAVADELVIGENKSIETDPPGGEGKEKNLAERTPLDTDPPSGIPISSTSSGSPVTETMVFNPVTPGQSVPNTPVPSQLASRVEVRPPAPDPIPVKTTVIEYWIQVGSFTKSSQAEENKRKLASQGVSSVIRTKAVEGNTYFRVRVGPYDNKGEAEKFLGWIRALPNYSDSYISELSVTRTR